MINRHNSIVIIVAAVISAGIWIVTLSHHHTKQQEPVSAKVFQGPDGWGYDILVKDTIFIHQEHIPVIAAKKGFEKKQQAEEAAALVLEKIQQNKIPTLTKPDIEHICSR
jgi:Domain of unknown function (DUF4907)